MGRLDLGTERGSIWTSGQLIAPLIACVDGSISAPGPCFRLWAPPLDIIAYVADEARPLPARCGHPVRLVPGTQRTYDPQEVAAKARETRLRRQKLTEKIFFLHLQSKAASITLAKGVRRTRGGDALHLPGPDDVMFDGTEGGPVHLRPRKHARLGHLVNSTYTPSSVRT